METEGAHKISGWENKVSGCESNQRSRGRGVSALGSFLVFFFFFRLHLLNSSLSLCTLFYSDGKKFGFKQLLSFT